MIEQRILRLGLVLGSALLLATSTIALADQLTVDNDLGATGLQNGATIGYVAAGAAVTAKAQLILDYSASPKHLEPGTSVTFSYDAHNSVVPTPVTASDVTIAVPADWSAASATLAGWSNISFNAPTAGGSYLYTVKWTPTAWTCAVASESCITGTAAFTIGLAVDTTAPTTLATLGTTPNGAGWINTSPVSVTLTATDNAGGSGVAATYYAIDLPSCTSAATATCSTYTAPLSVTGDGTHTVTFFSTDVAGNTETQKSIAVNIDTAKPVIAVASRTAANTNGWNNTAVTVTFTCTDTLSGLAVNTVLGGTLSTEGAGQSLTNTGVCADFAGNVADSATATGIDIDLTAPVIATSGRTPANGNGWNNGPVTVSFSCSDALSGLDTNTVAGGTLPAEGADQSLTSTGTCTDKAGNAAAAATATGINIDTTKPVITGVAAPAANGAGWNNTNVTVTFTCADGLSGVDADTVQGGTLSAEGTGLSLSNTGGCTDKAGSVADLAAVSGIKIDKTSPSVTAAPTSAPNANGWYNGPVTVQFSCTDALSGVATCPSDVTLGTDGTGLSASGTAFDVAGNRADIGSLGINIDQTAPTISASATTSDGPYTAGAWSSKDVTVHFACSDGGSGIASCPSDVVVTSTTASTTGTATDLAGNTATATFGSIAIDKVAPVWSPVTGNVAIATGANGAAVTYATNATDAGGSGLATSSCSSASGSSFPIGTTSVTCNAADNAGNTAAYTFPVRVTTWAQSSTCFLSPLSTTTTSSFKPGQTIPVKCYVPLASASTPAPTVTIKNSATNAVMPTTDSGASSGNTSSMRYDASLQGYIYNWQTPKTLTGSFTITIAFIDASTAANPVQAKVSLK